MGVQVREKIKGSGQWWVFLNHNGRRKSKLIGDKDSAQAVAKELRKQISQGEFKIAAKKIPVFQQYAEKWLNGYVQTTCKYATWLSYEHNLKNHLKPAFGSKNLDAISRADIKEYMFAKARKGNFGMIDVHRKKLSSIFSHALEDELIDRNPASKLGRIMPKKDEYQEIDPLTREEAELFLDTVEEHYPDYYELFLASLRTGMKIGEVLALQWGDIDFNGMFLQVKRNFSNKRLSTPKNKRLRRVDMSDQLAAALKKLRIKRKEQTLRKGWGEVPKWVFISSAGTHCYYDNLRDRVFKKALEKAGLRQITMHNLRHTYASLLVQQGTNPVYVSRQLGHSSIKITVDIYGHLVPGQFRNELNKLDTQTHPIRTQKENFKCK